MSESASEEREIEDDVSSSGSGKENSPAAAKPAYPLHKDPSMDLGRGRRRTNSLDFRSVAEVLRMPVAVIHRVVEPPPLFPFQRSNEAS